MLKTASDSTSGALIDLWLIAAYIIFCSELQKSVGLHTLSSPITRQKVGLRPFTIYVNFRYEAGEDFSCTIFTLSDRFVFSLFLIISVYTEIILSEFTDEKITYFAYAQLVKVLF